MRGWIAALLSVLALPAAACPEGQTLFLDCDMERGGKALQVCRSETQVSYRFGPKGGTPELALTRPIGEGAEFVPWPGIGRTIWEAVRLRNNAVIYEVYAGFDKFDAVDDSKPDSRFGGVVVMQDEKGEIAHLKCRAGTVDYGF
ncbi:MAG: hypothetical protein KBT70_12655 [Roseovarius sp.]|uniref:hypothetical protein n=1 Tax=Roseovarius sp. TaxID=1486281 RepID=UPI001B404A56|nr:hypothetical protein [Roseovarius sp.]MBQ0751040.1 hypothetical protein [Roseovarius sp.]MBQ0810617.1 hypothetical protein [Roseovarius sp.]